jgi:GTP cyclohydrolase II
MRREGITVPLYYLRPAIRAVLRAIDPRRLSYNRNMSSIHVKKVAEADFPSRWGTFRILGFVGNRTDPRPEPGCDDSSTRKAEEDMVVLVMGDVAGDPPLVRIHSQCLTGDVFGSLRCDCRPQLEMALRMIAEAGRGILVYEQQEGRGIGLMPKLQAYALQDSGLDTVEANEELGFKADCRDFDLAAAVLRHMGVTQVRLITSNPEKIAALEAAGIQVTERVAAAVAPQATFERYLEVKREKLGHLDDSPARQK